jgi:uncharacterized membrane protein
MEATRKTDRANRVIVVALVVAVRHKKPAAEAVGVEVIVDEVLVVQLMMNKFEEQEVHRVRVGLDKLSLKPKCRFRRSSRKRWWKSR